MPRPLERIIHDTDELKNIVWVCEQYLKARGKPFKITVTSDLTRTLKQNKFIHAVFKQISEKMQNCPLVHISKRQHSATYWKNYCKEKLGKKIVHFDMEDNPFVEVVSTTKYTTTEMMDFFIKIQAHFIENYAINITEPKGEEDE